MSGLSEAIQLAAAAHRGQIDKAGQPYILHPLRVMFRFTDPELQTIAVLHDVIEDTDYTLTRLRELGFSERVLAALDCLTRRPGESYEAFIERIRPNAVARQVKLADLEDNMDIRRLSGSELGPHLTRLARYKSAWARLQEEPEGERATDA